MSLRGYKSCICYFLLQLLRHQSEARGNLEGNEEKISHALASSDFINPGEALTITCSSEVLGWKERDHPVRHLSIEISAVWNSYRPVTVALINKKQFSGVSKFPPGRQWMASFHEDETSTPGGHENKTIELILFDATCLDAGTYICRIIYFSAESQKERQMDVWQNITYKVPLKIQKFELLNRGEDLGYKLHDVLNFTCIVNGPSGVNVSWLWQIGKGALEVDFMNTVERLEPTSVNKTRCDAFIYTTFFTLQLTELYADVKVTCMAEDGEKRVSKNIILYAKTDNLFLKKESNVMFIVLFVIVLLLMSLTILIFRRFLSMRQTNYILSLQRRLSNLGTHFRARPSES